MAIYAKPNRALYCTLVGKSKALTNTIALWLAFAPSSLHFMNTYMYVILNTIPITSNALSITIKCALANHTKWKHLSTWLALNYQNQTRAFNSKTYFLCRLNSRWCSGLQTGSKKCFHCWIIVWSSVENCGNSQRYLQGPLCLTDL
jgi:hypothetical protein